MQDRLAYATTHAVSVHQAGPTKNPQSRNSERGFLSYLRIYFLFAHRECHAWSQYILRVNNVFNNFGHGKVIRALGPGALVATDPQEKG